MRQHLRAASRLLAWGWEWGWTTGGCAGSRGTDLSHPRTHSRQHHGKDGNHGTVGQAGRPKATVQDGEGLACPVCAQTLATGSPAGPPPDPSEHRNHLGGTMFQDRFPKRPLVLLCSTTEQPVTLYRPHVLSLWTHVLFFQLPTLDLLTPPSPFKAGPFGTPQDSLASRRLTLISGTNAMTGLSIAPAKMLVILKIRV